MADLASISQVRGLQRPPVQLLPDGMTSCHGASSRSMAWRSTGSPLGSPLAHALASGWMCASTSPRASRNLQVVANLQVDPEQVRRTEVAGEPQSGVSRDPPLAVNDLVDTPRRYLDRHGNPVL